jgi:hypothetical protein
MAAEATASGDLEPTAAAPATAVAATDPGLMPKSHDLPRLPPRSFQTSGNESRITIGRVEVQVNSGSPQLPATSRSEPVRIPRPASALLEAYYLARFPLRP